MPAIGGSLGAALYEYKRASRRLRVTHRRREDAEPRVKGRRLAGAPRLFAARGLMGPRREPRGLGEGPPRGLGKGGRSRPIRGQNREEALSARAKRGWPRLVVGFLLTSLARPRARIATMKEADGSNGERQARLVRSRRVV